MNRLITLSGCALMAISAYAAVVTPVCYTENFVEMESVSDYPIDGWLTYGNGAVPAPALADYFGDNGDGPYYLLLRSGDACYAFSSTCFEPSTPADQWLVSPEIEIPADEMELAFTAAVSTNRGQWGIGTNPVKVLVSKDGPEKENFIEVPVYEGTVRGSTTVDVAIKRVYCPLNGFGGEKVRIAFVAGGENIGITGFTDIAIANYAITFDNKTTQVVTPGSDVVVDLNIGMKAPVTCPGFTAVLEAAGQTQTKTFTKAFGGNGTTLLYQRVTFDPISLGDNTTVDYKVTVTPNYEGAPESYITGAVGVPSVDYPYNVVMEELTATGCQACPSGMAAIEYYHDTYTGDDGRGVVIPIAIHGNINYPDPMNEGVEGYVASTIERNTTSSYPQAIFNRSSRGLMPDRRAEVESQISRRSYNKATISKVIYPDVNNPWSQDMTVEFDVRNGYDAEVRQLTAAVVMVEDNVQGNTAGYIQTNGFYNRDATYVETAYGAFLVPYMRKYLSGGELGMNMIPFDRMSYQHVARGIFPSYSGETLSESWVADQPKACSLTFKVPETVMELRNTAVVVLVMDEAGDIVASDKVEFANYGNPDSVALTGNDAVKVSGADGRIEIYAPSDAIAEAYSIDGRLIGSCRGTSVIETSECGAVIVRIESASGISTHKVIM